MCPVVVSCCSLDWQRPLGEDLYHSDKIVMCQRQVANATLGVLRLHGRPVLARDRFWEPDVIFMEGKLDIVQQTLREWSLDTGQSTTNRASVGGSGTKQIH